MPSRVGIRFARECVRVRRWCRIEQIVGLTPERSNESLRKLEGAMSEQDEHETNSNIQFINSCMYAIGDREYRKALTILGDGLHQVAESPTTIDMGALLKRLQTMLAYLDSRLAEDFGEKWAVESGLQAHREIRCSFCGKPKREAREIVAGPGVFICSDCVRDCDNALKRPTRPKLLGTAFQ